MSVRGKSAIKVFLKCGLSQIWLLKHLKEQLHSSSFEIQFVSFIWLSQFLLLPFPFTSGSEFSKEFFLPIEKVALTFLSSAGNVRNAASIFLGTFYSRKEFQMASFIGEITGNEEYLVWFKFCLFLVYWKNECV